MNKTHLPPPRGLIVSCQAAEGEPLYGLNLMRYMARAAVEGGAVAIRALAEEIPAIKAEVSVPVIGLVKRVYPDSEVYITPTEREIYEVIESGADVLAMDVTGRVRPGNVTTKELMDCAKERDSAILLMADCDTLENALEADALGFDFIGTTMRGYTPATEGVSIPDYALLHELRKRLKHAKLIAEGGIWEKAQLARVLQADPYAVVIGSAITRPKNITQRFNDLLGKL